MEDRPKLDSQLRRQLRQADALHESEGQLGSSDSDQDGQPAKRGRKAIPFAWS